MRIQNGESAIPPTQRVMRRDDPASASKRREQNLWSPFPTLCKWGIYGFLLTQKAAVFNIYTYILCERRRRRYFVNIWLCNFDLINVPFHYILIYSWATVEGGCTLISIHIQIYIYVCLNLMQMLSIEWLRLDWIRCVSISTSRTAMMPLAALLN